MELIEEMRTSVSCYIKQKLRTCPCERLRQIESELIYLKKARGYLKQQYKELIEQVEQLKILHFKSTEKRYLDGFCWRGHEEELERLQYLAYCSYKKVEHTQRCPFSSQDCEFQFLLKTNMKNFLLQQLMIETQCYNTLLTIYKAVCAYHHMLGSPSAVFIRFSIENDWSKALYYPMSGKGLVSSIMYAMRCFEKKCQDKNYNQQTLHFRVHEESGVLTNTGLLHLDEKATIIELYELVNWLEEGEAFKLKSLYELLRQIRGNSATPISIYGQLDSISISDKTACTTYFRKQGFRILGALKDDEWFEQECIIYCVI